MFGRIAQAYFQRYGDKSDALARIAAKNHKNGASNPLAQIQKDLGYEFCRTGRDKNPLVAGPLRRTDCSLVSDGAAALVLTDVETALACKKAVVFRAAEHVNDFLPMSKRDIIAFEGPALAWKRALASARVGLDDLSFAEVHDCFTIAELIDLRGDGADRAGRGRARHRGGLDREDGKLPVNASGGLKAKGHPIGATGVSMHVLAAMQLTGTAGGIQVKDAELGARVQHGRRRGRELRQHPRTAALRRGRHERIQGAAARGGSRARSARASPSRSAKPTLPPGEVTVAVDYSTLNYKDGMILNGIGRLVRNYPHVPGIDFAGTVEQSSSPDFKPGDTVVLTGWRVGEAQLGRLCAEGARQGEPAGAAAERALDQAGDGDRHGRLHRDAGGDGARGSRTEAGRGDVLVTGAAGGVGSVAVALLARLGYKVTASTGRPETHDYLKSLGASAFIDRAELAKVPARPLDSERWAGAIDSVGGTTLATVLTQMAYRASVASCGLAGGSELPTRPWCRSCCAA